MTELMENDIWADQAASHPGGQMLTKRMIQRALQGGWLTKHSRLLDLGCGSGETVKLLRSMNFQAEGIDLRADKHEAYLVKGDASLLPWKEHFFQGVLAECTLSVMDTGKVLPEVLRILEPGGIFLVSDIFELGRRPTWPETYNFELLYLENATPCLRNYISQWIWKNERACPPLCLEGRKITPDNLSYYYAILRKKERGQDICGTQGISDGTGHAGL